MQTWDRNSPADCRIGLRGEWKSRSWGFHHRLRCKLWCSFNGQLIYQILIQICSTSYCTRVTLRIRRNLQILKGWEIERWADDGSRESLAGAHFSSHAIEARFLGSHSLWLPFMPAMKTERVVQHEREIYGLIHMLPVINVPQSTNTN